MSIKSIKQELKKVIWPTPKQTTKQTLSVILIVLLVSFIVIVFDFIFVKANDFVIDKTTGGKVTQYREEIQQKQAILEEMKQYADETTMQTYNSIAYYMSVEDLQKALEELKNPTTPEDSDKDGESEDPNKATE